MVSAFILQHSTFIWIALRFLWHGPASSFPSSFTIQPFRLPSSVFRPSTFILLPSTFLHVRPPPLLVKSAAGPRSRVARARCQRPRRALQARRPPLAPQPRGRGRPLPG